MAKSRCLEKRTGSPTKLMALSTDSLLLSWVCSRGLLQFSSSEIKANSRKVVEGSNPRKGFWLVHYHASSSRYFLGKSGWTGKCRKSPPNWCLLYLSSSSICRCSIFAVFSQWNCQIRILIGSSSWKHLKLLSGQASYSESYRSLELIDVGWRRRKNGDGEVGVMILMISFDSVWY